METLEPTWLRITSSFVDLLRTALDLQLNYARMSLEASTVASATIEILEGRLRRLEYLLTGDSQWTGQPSAAPKPESFDDTVARRLSRLETALNSLNKSNPAVRDMLQLCMFFSFCF